MTHEQAEFLLNAVYMPQIQNEHKTTRRVIEAIPASNSAWKPDPKAKSALDLAWHIAASECFFLDGVANGKFGSGGPMPESIKTPADVVKWYDENFPKATAGVASLKGEALTRMIDFHGVFNFPAIRSITAASFRRICGPWGRRCQKSTAVARMSRLNCPRARSGRQCGAGNHACSRLSSRPVPDLERSGAARIGCPTVSIVLPSSS